MQPQRTPSTRPRIVIPATAHRLTATVLLVCVSTVAVERAVAQADAVEPLSGRYTIGPDVQGPSTFRTLGLALRALEKRGVRASVELVCPPGETEVSLELGPIEGTSPAKTVTFRGARDRSVKGDGRVMWVGNGTPIVSIADDTKHIVFSGITFAGSKATGAIVAGAGCSEIEIRECTFEPDVGRTVPNNSLMTVSGSGRSESWHIHHNTFSIHGGSYGLHFSEVGGFDIHDNLFAVDGVQNTLYFINKNDAYNKIHHNTIVGATERAIHIAASNLSNWVTNNVIVTRTTAGYAIETFGNSSNFNRVFGNLLVVEGGGGGIFLSHKPLLHVRADGNLFAATSGMIGSICIDSKSDYTTIAEWREATAQLPLGTCDKESAAVDPKFLAEHKEMIEVLRTGSAGDPAVLKRALGLLGATDIGHVRLAIHTMARAGRAGRQAIPMLTTLCRHKDRSVRADAAHAIGAIQVTAEIAVPELQRLLADEDPLVVQNAARALAQLMPFSRSALPDLQKLAQREYDDHGMTKAILERAIARITLQ